MTFPFPMVFAPGRVFLNGPEVDETITTIGSSDTTHIVDMPLIVRPKDLLLNFFQNDGGDATTFNDGFTKFFSVVNGTSVRLSIAYKWAIGNEGGITVTVDTTGEETSKSNVYRIAGAANPASQAPEASTGATGDSTSPNPDSLTPTGGSKKYLWLAVAATNGLSGTSFNGGPSGFINRIDNITSPGGISTAQLQEEASSKNPTSFSITPAATEWVAATVAIHPA